MEADYLFRDLKEQSQVVKVLDCTYSREEKQDYFYLCNCKLNSKDAKAEADEEFVPICEACMLICHSKAGHTVTKHHGRYDCKCGENKHDERVATNNDEKECFYSKFTSITGELNLYDVDGTVYCQFCIEKGCVEDSHQGMKKAIANGEERKCKCQKHETIGVLNIEKTEEIVKNCREDVSNFNINFFFVDEQFQAKTIKYFSNKIIEINGPQGEKLKENFFTDYKLFKILCCFDDLRKVFKDRNTTLDVDKFLEYKVVEEEKPEEENEDEPITKNRHKLPRLDSNKIRDVAKELLQYDPKKNFQDSEFIILSESKLLFAQFIYYISYHSFFAKFNINDLNRNTIANMNLFQRYIYIHEFKNFYKLNPNNAGKEEITELLKDLSSYVDVVVGMFDKLLDHLKENAELKFIKKPFEIYNSLVKNLIKRGLLDSDNIKTYFEIVYKTLKKLGDENSKHFSFQIIKSIYYVLLYNNDMMYLKKHFNKNYKDLNFSFNSCDQNNLINKIFLKILNIQSRERTDSEEDNIKKRRLLKFDNYVKKILDLSVGDNSVNSKAVHNMMIDPAYCEMLMADDVHEEIQRRKLSSEENVFFRSILKTTTKLLEINEKYIHYKYDNLDGKNAFNCYYKDFNDIMRELKFEINKELKSVPQVKTHVFLIDTEQSSEENTKKIKQIKEAVKYTNFIQAVNGFLKIFADRKEYIQHAFGASLRNEMSVLRGESNSEYVTFLFRFIYMLIKEEGNVNLENLVFLNMMDVKSFMLTFEDNKNYLDFFNNVNQLFFGKINQRYKFENADFMCKILKRLTLDCVTKDVLSEINDENGNSSSNNSNFRNIDKITLAMRIVLKMVRHCTSDDCSFSDFLALIYSKLKQIFTVPGIKTRFSLKGQFQQKTNETVQEFLYRYFSLCNEVFRSDLRFFDLFPANLFTQKEINEDLLRPNIYLKVNVRMALKEYLAHHNYYIRYNIKNTRLTNLFRYPEVYLNKSFIYQGCYFSRENLNLANLANYPKIKGYSIPSVDSEENKKFHLSVVSDKIEEFSRDYLNVDNFLQTLSEVDKVQSLMIRRIILIRYFENAMLRPVFSLVNQLLLNATNIQGKDLFITFEMIKSFFQCFKEFIDFITKSDSLKDSQKEVDTFKLIDLENQELLFYPVGKIEVNDLKKFVDFELNKIKYYDFSCYVNKFFQFVNSYTQPSQDKSKREDELLCEISEYVINFYKIDYSKPYELSLIKTVHEVDSEEVKNLGENLIDYLFQMLEDSDSLANIEIYGASGKKDRPQIFSFKYYNEHFYNFSHLYFFKLINRLFSLDYQTYQSILVTYCKQNYNQFMLFLRLIAIYNMYSLSVHESIKFYEIKRLHPKGAKDGNMSLTLSIVFNTIKFLQNLCEGHNAYYQKTLMENFTVYSIEDFDEEDFELFNLKPKQPSKALKSRPYDLSALDQYSKRGTFEDVKNLMNEIKELKKGPYDKSALDQYSKLGAMEDVKDLMNENDQNVDKFLEKYEPEGTNGMKELLVKKKKTDMFNFLNFLFVNLKLMIYHSNYTTICFEILHKKQNTDDSGLSLIRERMENLLLEMVQGADDSFFKYFYNGSKHNDIVTTSILFDICKNEDVENYSFLKYLLEIRNLYNHMMSNATKNPTYDFRTAGIICNCFKIINTIISQQKKKDYLIYQLTKHFFPLKSLIETSVRLLNEIYKKYLSKEKEREVTFSFEEMLKEIMELFKRGNKVSEDPIFKLPAEIFLFITVISEKFEDEEAQELFKLDVKEKAENKEGKLAEENNSTDAEEHSEHHTHEEHNHSNKKVAPAPVKIKHGYTPPNEEKDYNKDFERELKEKEIYEENKIQTIKFFTCLIKKVEFIIKSRDEEPTSKIIYFLVDPKTYGISKENMDSFFKNVDRSSSTTKLKSLIKEIGLFSKEVELKGKSDFSEKSKKMLEFEYEFVHKVNFYLGALINLILLLFLTDENFVDSSYHSIILFLSFIQIGVNVYFIYFYFSSKFNYILEIETERYKAAISELCWRDKIEIYLWRAILHEDMALFYFNVTILVTCLLSKYSLFLYPFLLFSVLKFDSTIREVVLAFRLSFKQIMEMIGFLAILIYFYANFGFFFMYDEFNMTLDSGETTNMCSSLLQCYITYFNFGIRSGGGIGDIIGVKAYSEGGWFWLRWVTDMIFYITVILLIMNMINGIIITTFSTRRQIIEEITEDQDNKCFICSRHIMKFLAKQKDFQAHIKDEHNFKDYIRYFLIIKSTEETMLDADQSYIKNCMDNDDIAFFPVAKTLYISGSNDEDEDEDRDGASDEQEQEDGLKELNDD